jgi:hypothetical protein
MWLKIKTALKHPMFVYNAIDCRILCSACATRATQFQWPAVNFDFEKSSPSMWPRKWSENANIDKWWEQETRVIGWSDFDVWSEYVWVFYILYVYVNLCQIKFICFFSLFSCVYHFSKVSKRLWNDRLPLHTALVGQCHQ